MKKIPLTQGQFALVDDWYFNWLSQWKWFAQKDGNTYYAMRNTHGKNRTGVSMHRLILRLSPHNGMQVDHIDGDGLNNRLGNLRLCTNQQNSFNQKSPPNKTSQYKGVHKKTRNRWVASLKYEGKIVLYEYFENEKDAALAYDQAAIKYFGEFARLNFPICEAIVKHAEAR